MQKTLIPLWALFGAVIATQITGCSPSEPTSAALAVAEDTYEIIEVSDGEARTRHPGYVLLGKTNGPVRVLSPDHKWESLKLIPFNADWRRVASSITPTDGKPAVKIYNAKDGSIFQLVRGKGPNGIWEASQVTTKPN